MLKKLNAITSKLGERMGLDVPYLLKNSKYIASRQAAGFLSGFIFTILLTRLASKQLIGEYNYLLSLLGVLSLTSLPGINTAILKSTTNEKDATLIHGTLFRIIASLLGSIIILILFFVDLTLCNLDLCQKLNLFRESQPAWLWIVVAATFPFLYGMNGVNNFFLGQERFDLAAKYSAIGNFAISLIQIIVLFLNPELTWLILVYVISNIGTNVYLFRVAQRYQRNQQTDKQVFSYGSFITMTTALNYIIKYIDKVLIGLFASPTAVATYAIAKTIPESLSTNFKSFLGIPLIRLIPQRSDKMIHAASVHMFKLLLVGASLAGICFITFPYIYPLLYTGSFQESIPLAQIMALSLIFFPFNNVGQNLIIYQDEKVHMLIVNVGSNILRIVLYIVLYMRFNMMGIAVSHLITEGVLFIYFLIYVVSKMHALRNTQ